MEPKRNLDFYLKHLKFEPHLNENYFMHVYQSPINVEFNGKTLSSMNSIYSLMRIGSIIDFRFLPYDEILTYHDGNPLEILSIDNEGKTSIEKLGKNVEKGEKFQVVVKGNIFSAIKCCKDDEYGFDFGLVGAIVSPAFCLEYFKTKNVDEILKEYPSAEEEVKKFFGLS